MAERRRAQEAAAATVLAAALACLRGPGGAKEPKEPLTAAALARPTLKTMQTALHLLHLRIRGAARTKKVRAAASAAGCSQLLRRLCAALSAVAGTGPRAPLSVRHFSRDISPDGCSSVCCRPYAVLQELQHIYPVLEPGQAKEFKAAMQEWVRELGELPQVHWFEPTHNNRLRAGLPSHHCAACQALPPFANAVPLPPSPEPPRSPNAQVPPASCSPIASSTLSARTRDRRHTAPCCCCWTSGGRLCELSAGCQALICALQSINAGSTVALLC